MAVLFTSGDRSVEVTEDTGALVGAIDRLEGRRPYPRPLPVVNQRGGDLQIFNDNMALLRTLKEAAQTLAGGQQRRKAFVLVSEWFAKELSGLFEAMAPAGEAPEGGAAYVSGNLDAFAGRQAESGSHGVRAHRHDGRAAPHRTSPCTRLIRAGK